MFSLFCGLGAKKRTKPRVEFVQESDVHYYQQHIANVENKDNPGNEVTYGTSFQIVDDSTSFKTTPDGPMPVKDYVNQQVHMAVDRSQLNKCVQYRTTVKVKPQERSASVTPPNPNSNENRTISVNSKQVSGKGENPKRVQTVLNASEEKQKKLTTLPFTPNLRTNGRIPKPRQRLLEEKKLSTFQLSPNVPGIDNRLNNGQRHFQMRNLSVLPYHPNLQPSPTTQLMHQSPMRNQEKNRLISGSVQFPSSGSNIPLNFQALDAKYGAIPSNPEIKRKVQLEQLLIKPVVTMKGTAYDATRWFAEDIDTERNFHSSCTDFLKIVMLTKAEETAKRLKKFLCSDLIEPRYVPSEHIFRNRKLNHFHVFWNIMHQLPYYMKKWNKKTKALMIWFYEVGIRETLVCSLCKKHYSNWLKQLPVSDAVGSKTELNQWLFKLHDDVNRRSDKPNFQWRDYERRWAPKGARNNIGKADLQINDESKQDDMGNSLGFGVSPHQVLNLQQPDFMLQRGVNAAPNIYDDYPVYPAVYRDVNQVPPMGYD